MPFAMVHGCLSILSTTRGIVNFGQYFELLFLTSIITFFYEFYSVNGSKLNN